MKTVIQRVKQAKVEVQDKIVGEIGNGLLIFLGVGQNCNEQNADDLISKIIQLRIFDDENGKMNLSALDIKASILVVSQFTLYGDCSKGRRPSFDKACEPIRAQELYNYFVEGLRKQNMDIQTGSFGAMMDVSLINDGPVTFILEV